MQDFAIFAFMGVTLFEFIDEDFVQRRRLWRGSLTR